MKFKAEQKALLEAVANLQSLTERKTTKPVLSCLLIEAKSEKISLTATDLEIGAEIEIPAVVETQGQLAVPSKSLHDILRELSSSRTVEFEGLENFWLYLEAGKSKFRLASLNAEDFPLLPKREGKGPFFIKASTWVRMLEKVSFAMSRDETRFNLNGVYLHGQKDSGLLKAVATDGHRLAYFEEGLQFPFDYSGIVPRKGVSEIARFCERVGEGPVEVYLGERTLDLLSPGYRLFIRLVKGEFPHYEQVIPKEHDKQATVEKNALEGALRRVVLLANERSFGVKFAFSTGNLELSTQSAEKGEGKEELSSDYRGEFFQIGFNARYFLDVLQVMEGDRVDLHLKDPLYPCLLTSARDPGWKAVLMPMRT